MSNRWIVAFACAWINLFIFAVFRSGGVLYLGIIDLFHCTYQQAAWPVSLAGSVASLTGILSGFFTHYFETRWLIIFGVCLCSVSLISSYFATSINFITLTLGLVQGIGIGWVTNLLPAVLSAHFAEKKSIALGISYAGATLGAFIFPIVIQSLLTNYEFYETMLLLGALSLNGVAGGLLLRKPVEEVNPQKELETEVTDQQFVMEPLIGECNTIVYVEHNKLYSNITQNQQPTDSQTDGQQSATFVQQFQVYLKHDIKLLLNPYFVLCTFTYISFILDFVVFIIILPDVAKGQNIEDSDSRWLLSIYSITDFVGRILPGWLSHWNLVSDKSIYIISISVMGLCMALLVVAHSWIQFVLLSLLCGLVTGCQMVLSPAILSDYLGTENTAVAFGMSNFICGAITLATRPLIIGFKDIYGNYNLLGYLLSGVALSSGFLWIMEITFMAINK